MFYVSPVIIATKSSWLTAEGKQHTCNIKYNDETRVVCKINSIAWYMYMYMYMYMCLKGTRSDQCYFQEFKIFFVFLVSD